MLEIHVICNLVWSGFFGSMELLVDWIFIEFNLISFVLFFHYHNLICSFSLFFLACFCNTFHLSIFQARKRLVNIQSFRPYQVRSQFWSDFVLGIRFHRTYSHFGFRSPTKLMTPTHFHYPQPMPLNCVQTFPAGISIKPSSNFMSNTIHAFCKSDDNQMPAIKCSLCASRQSSSDESSVYVSIDSTTSSQESNHGTTKNQGENRCRKRLFVRIVASSKR